MHVSRKGLLNEILMPARGPAAIEACICPDRRLDAFMAENLSDRFIFSRIAVEYDLSAQVSKLVWCEQDAGTPPQIIDNQRRNAGLILRCAIGIHE